MNAERCTVYQSWTTVVELADVAALAPEAELMDLVDSIGGVLADTFNQDLVGFTFDPPEERLLVTFKHRKEAEQMAVSWNNIVEMVVGGKKH